MNSIRFNTYYNKGNKKYFALRNSIINQNVNKRNLQNQGLFIISANIISNSAKNGQCIIICIYVA